MLDLVFEVRPVFTGPIPDGMAGLGPLQDEVMAAADDLRELLPGERRIERGHGGLDSPRQVDMIVGRSDDPVGDASRPAAEGGSVKIRLERDLLAEAVQWAARSLPVRPSVPILAGLLVRADAESVTFSSFDYETSARISVPAMVADEGSVDLWPIARRHLAQPAGQPVDISADDSRMELICGSARFTLQTLPVSDYPSCCRRCRRRPAPYQRRVRRGSRPSRSRGWPRRITAGLHRSTGRD